MGNHDVASRKRVISCKWVYKVKLKDDGTLGRYKARLVVKGFTQQHETFSPVIKISIVRSILAIVVAQKWTLFQLNINNAFLHGDLMEEANMHPPEGVQVPPGLVYKLKKSLYGLKQALDIDSLN
ncbi:transmembrane signal receptor [Lithospermum erythrorhizon]|uniref:Transmembrane signal receptor n=1 Tax=Lithospermum erythrorhizon TaxID=34254 RepID=A0AAV3RJ33_LITER